MSVAVDASALEFRAYSGGIYDGPCNNTVDALGHAMLAVGYEVSKDGEGYFILKNSWGKEWGEGGYLYLKAHLQPGTGHCGVALLGSQPTKDGSVQYAVNGTWPHWALAQDPTRHNNSTGESPAPVRILSTGNTRERTHSQVLTRRRKDDLSKKRTASAHPPNLKQYPKNKNQIKPKRSRSDTEMRAENNVVLLPPWCLL